MATDRSDLKNSAIRWLAATRLRWKMIVAVFIVTFTIAAGYIARIPNVYHAETRILVNPQRVSDRYVSSAVSMGVTERLNTLSQQILSASRLEAILDEFNLFPNLRDRMTRQELIALMRRNIGIELKQSSNGPSSFTLSYDGGSPTEVAAVTNRLAESFIAWNIHDREQEAQGTTDFLASELSQSKTTLDSLEQQLRTYKLTHLGELPDQLQANLQALSRLEVQLQGNVEARNLLDRDALLSSQSQRIDRYTGASVAGTPRSASTERLATTRQELQELTKRYTLQHPDVIAKQHEVDALEASENSRPKTHPAEDALLAPPTANETQGSLLANDRSRLLASDAQIERQISLYQSRVDSEPIREQEISQLLRDYETARQHYALLLEKTYSAQMAAELERKQQGGSFTLLDVATVPDAPIAPNRRALLGGALVFALFAGFGCSFLFERVDNTVKSEEDLRACLPGVPVLGVTPRFALTPGASSIA